METGRPALAEPPALKGPKAKGQLALPVAPPEVLGFDWIERLLPYASVLVTWTNSTTATITFTSLTNSGNIYLIGNGSSMALNVNATTFTLGGISGSNAGTGFTPGPYSQAAAGNVDGLGTFNGIVDSFDGFTHSSDMVSFTLTDISGSWANAAAVLAANNQGFLAEAHIFVTSFPANVTNSALATGFAANTGAVVPDGGTTVMLLGAALGALGMARRFIMS